jgi:hypothetical protein
VAHQSSYKGFDGECRTPRFPLRHPSLPTSETPSSVAHHSLTPSAPARDGEAAGEAGNAGESGGSHGRAGKAALSRELSDFLVELSIAMQKYAIYPQGHPLLDAAVDGVMNKLALLLIDRNSLSLGIARRQLIIEGVATDPNHPLLMELAGRLHKHSLGAIKITQGFSREELSDALATVAVDPGRTEKPLGEDADELSERWANVRLYPLNYERLQLLYEGTDEDGEARVLRRPHLRAAQLWVGMARAAMMLDEDAEVDEKSMNPLVVAEAIDKRQQGGEAAYDQVIVGYLLQIAEELKTQGGSPEQVELQRRISDLVRQLSPATLKKLLQMGGDQAQRRQFLLNASQGMTVEAVLDLVKAASSEGRQTISHSMMRLFSKLARYAGSDADSVRRATAEESVREQMSKLISEWDLDDPNPTAYGRVLHRMARTRGSASQTTPYTEIEPERILQMGFELSAGGPRFDNALDAMLNSARFELVLNLLDRAPDQEFAEHAWSYLDSHDILWTALGEARIDLAVLTRLVRRKRVSAIDPILDTVERTKDSNVREQLLETLLELGDDIGPYLVRRLDTARADLRRDLFLLLGKLKRIPTDFDGSHFLLHTDAPVRREAIRLLLKYVETREHAIVAGVTDSDERSVFYGLSAAQEGGCPPRALEIIRQRIDAESLDGSLLTLAIRVLAAADSGAMPVLRGTQGRTSQVLRAADLEQAGGNNAKKTLDWLIGRVAQRSRFLRQWKLQPKSAEMLAALGALAAYWMNEPTVQQIVALAVKNGDADFKKAMAAPRSRGRLSRIAE